MLTSVNSPLITLQESQKTQEPIPGTTLRPPSPAKQVQAPVLQKLPQQQAKKPGDKYYEYKI